MNDTTERATGLPANVAHDGNRIVSRIPPERKAEIVHSALERIEAGDRLPEIAADYGIATITLRVWLSALGDEYRAARAAWVDARLARAEEELEQASDQLSQSRARDLLKYAQWQAERRDPARYGARGEGMQATQINIVVER